MNAVFFANESSLTDEELEWEAIMTQNAEKEFGSWDFDETSSANYLEIEQKNFKGDLP